MQEARIMNNEYSLRGSAYPIVSMLSAAFTIFVRVPVMCLAYIFFKVNSLIFVFPLLIGKKILFHSQAFFMFYLTIWLIAAMVFFDAHGKDVGALIDLGEYWYRLQVLWIAGLVNLIVYLVGHAMSSWWIAGATVVLGYAYIKFTFYAMAVNYEFIQGTNLNGLMVVRPYSIRKAFLYYIMPTYHWRMINAVFSTKSKGFLATNDIDEINEKTWS
jgi:hypothetical protein